MLIELAGVVEEVQVRKSLASVPASVSCSRDRKKR